MKVTKKQKMFFFKTYITNTMPVVKISNLFEYSIVYRISISNDSCPKELSLCHKLCFSNPYIYISFDISNYESNNSMNKSIKYKRFTP